MLETSCNEEAPGRRGYEDPGDGCCEEVEGGWEERVSKVKEDVELQEAEEAPGGVVGRGSFGPFR